MKHTSRILILDDEFLVLLNLMEELQRRGFSNIEPANSVSRARECIEDGKVDLAFLDVNLGAETSYPVASLLQARDIPFAFVTGYGTDAISAEFNDVPVITKPIDAGDVDDFLAEVLGTPGR